MKHITILILAFIFLQCIALTNSQPIVGTSLRIGNATQPVITSIKNDTTGTWSNTSLPTSEIIKKKNDYLQYWTSIIFMADSIAKDSLEAVQSRMNTIYEAIPINNNQLVNGEGFISSEEDPIFVVHPCHTITFDNISDWTTAYSWGNHATQGYITASSTNTFTNKSGNISQWTNDVNYLTTVSWSIITGKPSFATVATTGSYTDLINKPKVPTLYIGTTDASGIYTQTFPVAYSAAPDIQVTIRNQSTLNQFVRVTSITTTGFTVHVFQRNSVNLLGIDVLLSATANVNGASVGVLITEY